MYCWIEPLNGYTICTHTPPSEACGGLCDRPRNLVTRSPPAYRLSFSFSIKCGRILGRDSCWLSLLNSFHFRAASTVELLSELPKLILTISSRERGSYRGALHNRIMDDLQFLPGIRMKSIVDCDSGTIGILECCSTIIEMRRDDNRRNGCRLPHCAIRVFGHYGHLRTWRCTIAGILKSSS